MQINEYRIQKMRQRVEAAILLYAADQESDAEQILVELAHDILEAYRKGGENGLD